MTYHIEKVSLISVSEHASTPTNGQVTISERRGARSRWQPFVVYLAFVAVFVTACYGSTTPPAGPRGTLRFKCNQSEAVLVIDDTRLGPIGMFEKTGVLLKPGEHRLVVYKEGFFKEYKLVQITEDKLLVVEFVLTSIPD